MSSSGSKSKLTLFMEEKSRNFSHNVWNVLGRIVPDEEPINKLLLTTAKSPKEHKSTSLSVWLRGKARDLVELTKRDLDGVSIHDEDKIPNMLTTRATTLYSELSETPENSTGKSKMLDFLKTFIDKTTNASSKLEDANATVQTEFMTLVQSLDEATQEPDPEELGNKAKAETGLEQAQGKTGIFHPAEAK